MTADLNSKSVEGLIGFCDYLSSKGYAGKGQVDPWKTAIHKVFSAVEGEGYESFDLTGLDLDEYLDRFQKLAGAQYKAESITAYKRRIERAVAAHDHYIETGRPPSFRQRTAKEPTQRKESAGSVVDLPQTDRTSSGAKAPAAGLMEFPFPLKDGQLAKLHLPMRLAAEDVDRLSAFLRTLQDTHVEQRQISERAGQESQAA